MTVVPPEDRQLARPLELRRDRATPSSQYDLLIACRERDLVVHGKPLNSGDWPSLPATPSPSPP